ncbi:MAG: response regulator [Melioribacteraceae bacterium]|nr:response regulator [Melioribacteraceae bacterium]
MTNSMKESDTLLILESDKSLRKGVAVALLEYFIQITITTDNPKEAISASKRKDFSVIITGDEFPDQNGLEIIKQLRINNPLAKLYIISKNY